MADVVVPRAAISAKVKVFAPILTSVELRGTRPRAPFYATGRPVVRVVGGTSVDFSSPYFPGAPSTAARINAPESLPVVPRGVVGTAVATCPVAPSRVT